MNFYRLLAPRLLIFQLAALATSLGLFLLFGPPEAQTSTLPITPLPSLEEVVVSTGSAPPALRALREGLLSATQRPSALDFSSLEQRGDTLWGSLGNGWRGRLTLNPELQQIATHELGRSHSAAAAFVAIEIQSGRLLSLAEHFNSTHVVSRTLQLREGVHIALRSLAPGSVSARLVASAALLDEGHSRRQRTCYQSFVRTPQAQHLSGQNHNECRTLPEAFAESSKGYFTRQSSLALSGGRFARMLRQSGFNKPFFFFALPYEPSSARVPLSPLGRARAVSGTHSSRMSALHAALLATAVAGDGRLPQPQLVDQLIHEQGRRVQAPSNEEWAAGFSPESSAALRDIFRASTREGRVKKLLRDNWPNRLRTRRVAGQIGIETHYQPFYRYSWFIGFYPERNPRVAVASMVLNGERWYARALDVTSRILSRYFTQDESAASAGAGR